MSRPKSMTHVYCPNLVLSRTPTGRKALASFLVRLFFSSNYTLSPFKIKSLFFNKSMCVNKNGAFICIIHAFNRGFVHSDWHMMNQKLCPSIVHQQHSNTYHGNSFSSLVFVGSYTPVAVRLVEVCNPTEFDTRSQMQVGPFRAGDNPSFFRITTVSRHVPGMIFRFP